MAVETIGPGDMPVARTRLRDARALRLVSSPTIRVDGRDVALELRESSCGSEACTDRRGDQVACRVWVHRGLEYTEPPVAMIVDAILGHVYGGAPSSGACCSSSERESCCDPDAKASCCGAGIEESCGCR